MRDLLYVVPAPHREMQSTAKHQTSDGSFSIISVPVRARTLSLSHHQCACCMCHATPPVHTHIESQRSGLDDLRNADKKLEISKSILIAAESCTGPAKCETRLAEERDATGQILGEGGSVEFAK